MRTAECVKDDDLVDAVQELRPKVRTHHLVDLTARSRVQINVALRGQAATFGDQLAPQVGRHDDDGVPEIDRSSLPIGQPPVVKKLQQDVQHIDMRLLHFVEQHHGVRPPADRFRQLARFVVADIPGRRADESRDGVFLQVLRHVDPDQSPFVIEEELGESTRQLGLSDAGRTQEDEAAERAVRVLQTGPRAPNRIRHRANGVVLTDHPLAQAFFHPDQLLDFPFHQLTDGDVRPLADDRCDIFLVDLFLQHPWRLSVAWVVAT